VEKNIQKLAGIAYCESCNQTTILRKEDHVYYCSTCDNEVVEPFSQSVTMTKSKASSR